MSAAPPTHRSLRRSSRSSWVWMGAGGFGMPTASLACLPSASLICSPRRSAWTLMPACLRRAAGQPGKASQEHPAGPGPGRGPARGRAKAVQAGDLRPVLPLDRRTASGRDRLRHAGAQRCAGSDRARGEGRPRTPGPGVLAIPHEKIKALVEKYLGSTRRAGQGTVPERIPPVRGCASRTRFGVPQQFFVPGIPDLLRDSESVLSGYLSTPGSIPGHTSRTGQELPFRHTSRPPVPSRQGRSTARGADGQPGSVQCDPSRDMQIRS
jgi:hypothetical protein